MITSLAMAHSNCSAGSVLIIERDASIRQMMQALLSRAGFTIHCVADDDGSSLLPGERFDAIVRDADLARRESAATLDELERVPREVMRRTVITTTFPARLLSAEARVRPFGVVGKPFDIDVLVGTIRQCCEQSRRPRPRAGRPNTVRDEPDGGNVDVGRIRKFVGNAGSLRALLTDDAASNDELLLCAEIRRTVMDLAHMLYDAAHRERNRARAAVLTGAALVAAELAGVAPAARPQTSGRDH